MTLDGVRGKDGTMRFEAELLAALAPLFVSAVVATQLFVPELILEPRAMFERVSPEEGALGVVMLGIEGVLLFTVAGGGE